MKALSANLIALLATRVFKMADLYTITLINGTILRLTSYDIDLFWGSLFSCNGFLIARNSLTWKNDLSVDALVLTINPQPGYTINGIPFLQTIRRGLLDNATVALQRAFIRPSDGVIRGVVNIFTGRVADIDPADRTEVQVTVNSQLDILSLNMPRNIYEIDCGNMLFDANCTMVEATYTTAGTVGAGATLVSVPISVVHSDNYYQYGVIKFTSGACNGLSFPISRHASNVVYLDSQLPGIPATGDTILVVAGCDHTVTTCRNKFSNSNDRAFPFIPAAETAV